MNVPIENNARPNLKLNDPNNLFLIDGSGYIFRAFYGLPSMSNGNGVPVNAVFGYTKMLLNYYCKPVILCCGCLRYYLLNFGLVGSGNKKGGASFKDDSP